MGSEGHVLDDKKILVKEIHILAQFDVRLEDSLMRGFMVHQSSEPYVLVLVKSNKHIDPLLMEYKESVLRKSNDSFS